MYKIIISLIFFLFLSACTTTGGDNRSAQKKSSDLKKASNLNVQLAVGYIKRKQFEEAKIKLKKAIEQDDENLDAYKTFAYLYGVLGLQNKAEEQYEKALAVSSNEPDLLNSYGVFLCSRGKYDEAQEQFKQAYSNPFYKLVFLVQSNAGSCYLKQDKYRKAEVFLRKSLSVAPNIAGSLISMAEVGLKTKRYLIARAYIERYHGVHAVTAESLWIQSQAEHGLGDQSHYMKYAQQLIKDFPDSDQAGWVEAQVRHDKFK